MNILLMNIFLNLLSPVNADECPMTSGRYGKGIQYQNMLCKFLITADKKDSSTYRAVIFNNDGQVQVSTNFKNGGRDSDAARVYYIYPLTQKKEITTISENELVVEHGSGARFKFDSSGRVTSPDVNMSFSKEINGQNKSGVEINNFSKGLVLDFGYKAKGTPLLVASAPVEVTDKNNKKCQLINSDLHVVGKNDYKVRYKTNEALHGFFAKRCPGLDISDLLKPFKKDLDVVKKPSTVGAAPKVEEDIKISDESRKEKETVDEMEALVEEINSTSR